MISISGRHDRPHAFPGLIFPNLDKISSMFGTLNNEEIENILHHQVIGRVGCHANNTTYVVPVSFAYSGDCVYALTGEGMKIQFMRQNPQVCFEVEELTDPGNWKSVICWGEFEELTDDAERMRALELLYDRHLPMVTSATTRLSPSWPFRPDSLNSIPGIAYRIRLFKKTGKFEKQDISSIYSWQYGKTQGTTVQ